MATKLPRESFVALAAVAWADGRMNKVEADGLLHAARTLGLAGDDLAAVERAATAKVGLEAFDPSKLSAWERLLTYGLATWLSRIDGVQQSGEIVSLRTLAERLATAEVTEHRLRAAAAVAIDVAMLPGGRRPDRYDFAAFDARLNERVPAVK
jgi:hypothetical protein